MIREVMPWKATDPACVTVIRATEQRWTTVDGRLVRVPYRLSKLITEDAVEGYDKATWVCPTAWRLDGVDDVFDLLVTLEPCTSACVIRAALRPEFATHQAVMRRLHDRPGEPALFVEVPRSWVMIDVEHLPDPGRRPHGPAHGRRRGAHAPAAAVPRARCVAQLRVRLASSATSCAVICGFGSTGRSCEPSSCAGSGASPASTCKCS